MSGLSHSSAHQCHSFLLHSVKYLVDGYFASYDSAVSVCCFLNWQSMSQLIPKSAVLIVDNFCAHCGNKLTVQDNFCRRCGVAVHDAEATTAISVANAASSPTTAVMADHNTNTNQWTNSANTLAHHNQSSAATTVQTVLNNRLYVGLVIALIGPLGLPALWFSPRFSQKMKVILTALFVFLTIAVPIAITWFFLDYSIRPLVDAFGR